MTTIIVKYLPPTTKHGSRLSAKTYDGMYRIVWGIDHSKSIEYNKRQAAERVAELCGFRTGVVGPFYLPNGAQGFVSRTDWDNCPR